jgi:GNAT superfamily N-acetyltransferase
MDILIRQATDDDIEAILGIYSQPSIDDGITLSTDEAKKIFCSLASYPSYKIYVAVINGVVVGTIAVLIMDNIGHLGRKSAIFESIAVLPQWQGKGVGRAIVTFATDICRKAECYKITLSANLKRSKAHSFYQSLGFIQHGFSYMYKIEP